MRPLVLVISIALLCICGVRAQQAPPPGQADVRIALDAARRLMESDPAAGIAQLERLVEQARALRLSRPLTEADRATQRDLYLTRARAYLQMLVNDKVEDSLRELLRIDPFFTGELTPREQELMAAIRKREGGSIEIASPEAGATVLVNDVVAGVTSATPLRFTVLAGDYEVRLEKEGFQPTSRVVNVIAGRLTSVTELLPTLRVVPLLFIVDREDVEVAMDGAVVGRTAKLSAMRALVGPAEAAALDQAAAEAGIDPREASGVLLHKPPLDRALDVRFRLDCYIEERRSVGVPSAMLGQPSPTQAVLWFGGASTVRMKPDTGMLRVTSTPSDAEVFLDNQLVGRTPFERSICAGPHHVRVRHRIGSFSAQTSVTRDRPGSIDAALKPGIAFLGAVETIQNTLQPSAALSSTIENVLTGAVTEFRVASKIDAPGGAQRWTDTSAAQLIAAADRGDTQAVTSLLRLAYDTYDAPLQIAAVKRPPSGGEAPVDLLLFWAEHAVVDRARWLPSRPQDLAGLLARLDAPSDAAAFVYQNELGLRAADTDLPGAPLMVVRVDAGSAAASAGIKPGDGIEAVDGVAMTAIQLQDRVRERRPGEVVNVRVTPADGGPPRQVAVPLQRRPRRGSVLDPTLFGNAMVARLTAASVLATNAADRDLFGFHLALVSMRFGQWKVALDQLSALGRMSPGAGVGPGAVAYYKGRCFEALSQRDQALAAYKEAATFGGEAFADDGASVAVIARRRLAFLGAR